MEAFGHLSIGELACVLASSRLLVSNDTGVSHIAAALTLPSVVIFSQYSDPDRWGPIDTDRHLVISAEESRDPKFVLSKVSKALTRTDAPVDSIGYSRL